MKTEVLIVDFGSQTTQLIARRVRELGVFCQVLPFFSDIVGFCNENGVRSIILSGGPSSVYETKSPQISEEVLSLGIPILGICYGMQTLVHVLGGQVGRSDKKEFGNAQLQVTNNSTKLFSDFEHLNSTWNVWMSHGDYVKKLPPGWANYVKSENSEFVVSGDPNRNIYGIQFHPEVTHSNFGSHILTNFILGVCDIKPEYNPGIYSDHAIQKIIEQIGPDGRALCALSGGVDSLVAARLVHMAIDDRLQCVMVDNGLLRLGEVDSVKSACNSIGIHITVLDESSLFLSALEGVDDPESRRKIIGSLFIDVFQRYANSLAGEYKYLVQGTIYPDVIESTPSVLGHAPIKSHHNVGGLPESMDMELVEPLRGVFKDEVRKIGLHLGLPAKMINRQPFPGPGLGVRCVGPITPERLQVLRLADNIVTEEIESSTTTVRPWQYFAILLPVKAVGVQGDCRTYEESCVIRCIESVDGMTANWSKLPYDLLDRISSRIVNEISGINRVFFDVTHKAPGTIEIM